MKITFTRGVSTAPVDDGLTLIGADGTVYHLNATGAAILAELVDSGIEGAVAMLTGRHGITEARARADVEALVTDMQDRRLVRRR